MADEQDRNRPIGLRISTELQGAADGPVGEAPSDLPRMRICVVAELFARPEYGDGADRSPATSPLTRATFDDVMSAVGTSLSLEVDNVFDDRGKALEIDVALHRFRDLRPREMATRVTELRVLSEAHGALSEARGAADTSEVRAALERILPPGTLIDGLVGLLGAAPAPGPPVGGAARMGDGLDALFASVALPGAADGASGRGGGPGDAIEQSIARVEAAFVRLLDAILEHPEVSRLEALWRSLWLLAAEASRDTGVDVVLTSVARGGTAAALALISDATDQEPPDLVVVGERIAATARELGELEAWAARAASLRAPLVADGDASLLGFDDVHALARSTSRISASSDPRAVGLRSLSAKDEARWVSLVVNRPLARAPYTDETARVGDITLPGDLGGTRYLHGAFVLAVLAARSFARYGIASAITGPDHGRLEDLPVHTAGSSASHFALPLETFIPSETQAEIARAGLVALGAERNRDRATVTAAPVLYRGDAAARGGDPAAAIGLGDQLFVGRFSYAVEQLSAAIPAGADAFAVADTARLVLHGFFEKAAPPRPEIDVVVDAGALRVTVRPRRVAGIAVGEVTLSAPIGAAR